MPYAFVVFDSSEPAQKLINAKNVTIQNVSMVIEHKKNEPRDRNAPHNNGQRSFGGPGMAAGMNRGGGANPRGGMNQRGGGGMSNRPMGQGGPGGYIGQ